MNSLEIVTYPDPRLRAKNAAVTIWDQALRNTARAMFDLMYQTEGVGLAAPQVGINQQLLVYNPEGSRDHADQELVLCNPRIVRKDRIKKAGEEGCLSFPGIKGSITRPISVVVEAKDLDGEDVSLELNDWEARIFLHEFDHLDGILFIDRMTPADKTLVRGALIDLQEEFQERASN